MSILSELNSIGGWFNSPMIFSNKLPEKIVMDALAESLEHPIIPGSVIAILDRYSTFFDSFQFEKLLDTMLANKDPTSLKQLAFSYVVLKKTGFISGQMAVKIKSHFLDINGNEVFGGLYTQLSKLTSSIAKIDPEFLELGFRIPKIDKVPVLKISENLTRVRNWNSHLKKRVCADCGGRTRQIPLGEIRGFRPFNLEALSGIQLLQCLACDAIAEHEHRRAMKAFKKIMVKEIYESMMTLKMKAHLKDKNIAKLLGVSPVHLSNLKRGQVNPSPTVFNFLKTLVAIHE